jgi:hypothetical protein
LNCHQRWDELDSVHSVVFVSNNTLFARMGNGKSTSGNPRHQIPKDHLRKILDLEDKKLAEQLQFSILDDNAKELGKLLKGHSGVIGGPVTEENLLNGSLYKRIVQMLQFAVEYDKVACVLELSRSTPHMAFGSQLFPDLNLLEFTFSCMKKYDNYDLSYDLVYKYWQTRGDVYSMGEDYEPLVLFCVDNCLVNSFKASLNIKETGFESKKKYLVRIADIGYKQEHFEMAQQILERIREDERTSAIVYNPKINQVYQWVIDHANGGLFDYLAAQPSNKNPSDAGMNLSTPSNWREVSKFKSLVLTGDLKGALQKATEDPSILEYPNKTFYVLIFLIKNTNSTQATLLQNISNVIKGKIPPEVEKQLLSIGNDAAKLFESQEQKD